MDNVNRRMPWPEPDPGNTEPLLTREWLVTNGLGGYASGTVAGVATRRYHGLLIAALPAPLGRQMMLNHLAEQVRLPDGATRSLRRRGERGRRPRTARGRPSAEFRLEAGLPVWRYEFDGLVLEKRILLPHRQNTVYVTLSAGRRATGRCG